MYFASGHYIRTNKKSFWDENRFSIFKIFLKSIIKLHSFLYLYLRLGFPVFFIASFLLFTKISVAQTPINPDSSLQVILGSISGTTITLEQAQQYARKNATSVHIAEAAYLAAKGAVRRDEGYFDPAFFLSFNYLDQQLPAASFFAGASVLNTQQTTYSGGFSLNLPTGTYLELSANAVRLSTNSQFAFLNPEFDALGTLSFSQPLLKGFSISARKQLSRSEQILQAEKARFDQEVLAVNSEVEMNYWDLYVSERDFAVQQLSRDQAKAFLQETDLRAKAGLLGPNEVANAKTFLAEQELQLLDREEQFESQSDIFASLIGFNPEDKMKRFIPTDEPSNSFSYEDVEVLVAKAIKNNLNLQALQKEINAAHISVEAAKWEAMPSVNLTGSISGNGLSGTAQNVVFGGDTLRTTRSGNIADALNQVIKRKYPNWSIGLEINLPIGLRSGLGEKDRLEAQFMSAQQNYITYSRFIEQQVRKYYRELSNGKKRLEAATTQVEAAKEQVRIGLIEFHNGRITAFELVRLGSDFASAQTRYSEALVRTAKAAASLNQLTSGIINKEKI